MGEHDPDQIPQIANVNSTCQGGGPVRQAAAMDGIREALADPGFGYPVPPACVFLIDPETEKVSAFESDRYAEAQEAHPDGTWGVIVGYGHGYAPGWDEDFAGMLADACRFGLMGDVRKAGVVFTSDHGGEAVADALRDREKIPVLAQWTNGFVGVPWDTVDIEHVVRAMRELTEDE